jgi:hypothetical protein
MESTNSGEIGTGRNTQRKRRRGRERLRERERDQDYLAASRVQEQRFHDPSDGR